MRRPRLPLGCFHGACAHTPRRVRREVALTAGADQRNCSVLTRVRPTSPSAFCLVDSSCSGLVSHLRGILHEHGLVHQILYEGAARGRQLLCGTRDAPSVGPPGLGRCSTRARAGGRSKAFQNNGMYLVRAGAHRPGGKGTPPWYFSTPYSIWQPALLRLMLSSRRPVRASTHLVVSSDQ